MLQRKSTGSNRTPKMRSLPLNWTREQRQKPSYRPLVLFYSFQCPEAFAVTHKVNHFFVQFYYSRNIPVITVVLMAWSVDDHVRRVHQAENHGILTLIVTANASALLHRPRSLGPGILTNSERESVHWGLGGIGDCWFWSFEWRFKLSTSSIKKSRFNVWEFFGFNKNWISETVMAAVLLQSIVAPMFI